MPSRRTPRTALLAVLVAVGASSVPPVATGGAVASFGTNPVDSPCEGASGGCDLAPRPSGTVLPGVTPAPGGGAVLPGGTPRPGGVPSPGGDRPSPNPARLPDGSVPGPDRKVTPLPGAPLWSADFEIGDLTGFDYTPWNQVGTGPPQIIRLDDGTRALALTIPAGGSRNEVVPDIPPLREGDDLYFAFSTYLVPGFPVDQAWQVLTQWKNDGTGSPPISLGVERDRFTVGGGYGHPEGTHHLFEHELGPAAAGVWDRWVFHIRFSQTPPRGFVEVWRNGKPVLAPFSPSGGTLYPGLDSYLKTGYYRNSAIDVDGTLVLDDWRIAGTRADPTDPAIPTPTPPVPRPVVPPPATPAPTPEPIATPAPTPTTTPSPAPATAPPARTPTDTAPAEDTTGDDAGTDVGIDTPPGTVPSEEAQAEPIGPAG